MREGYAATTIAQVIAKAGVSRPTFYDYFTDKDDCFLAALANVQQQLSTDIREAVEDAPGEQAIAATIRALIGFATTESEKAHYLMSEPTAGGPAGLDARDQGIKEIAQTIEQAQEQLAPKTATPDLSPHLLIGTIYRLLAARLRHDELSVDGMVDDLLEWVGTYEQPTSQHRWRALEPAPEPAPWPLLPEAHLRAPPPLQPGRPRRAEDVLANQRQRILFATAEATQAKGYTATTIADITKLAGVDHRVFAALFADKQQAFMAIHELGFPSRPVLTGHSIRPRRSACRESRRPVWMEQWRGMSSALSSEP